KDRFPMASYWGSRVFLVLLAVVISWVLVLIGSQPWTQHVTTWVLGGKQNEITDPNSWRVQLFVVFIVTFAISFFVVVMVFRSKDRFPMASYWGSRVFLVLLAVVISWVLVLIGSQPWTQHVTTWVLGGKQNEITDPNSWRVQLFVVFIVTFAISFFGVVMGF